MSETIKDFVSRNAALLAAAGVENPETDIRLLIEHVLKIDHAALLMNLNRMLVNAEVKDLDAAIARRAKREPVSRIIGRRGFWKYDFKVTPQTLDPRPDSETLVEAALKYATPAPTTILDLGTGTGCLLLSLLGEWINSKGVGLDISSEAVATARENAKDLKLDTRATFTEIDWAHYTPPAPFDLVISNPPYIAVGEMPGLAPEVTDYDPVTALVGGADGLDCYRSIAGLLPRFLKKGGWVVFEIGHAQANDVKSILANRGAAVIHTVQDLAGSDRVIVAQMP
ncbi:MAG: peptide chain release factor N(5)-glutamine methyltransferase [Alphaproteobacteria bacterium]